METTRPLTEENARRCACTALVAYEVEDCEEIPSHDWRHGWREFKVTGKRTGCLDHQVVSMTTYRDGRVVRSVDCQPEKVGFKERFRVIGRCLKCRYMSIVARKGTSSK